MQTLAKPRQLTWDVLLLLVAKTAGFVFSVALPLILVRRLDQTQFGLYKQIFLIVGTAIATIPLGFSTNAYYFLPREPENRRPAVCNIMAFHALAGGVCWLALWLYPSLLAALFHGPGLVGYASLIGMLIFLWSVSSFLEIIPIAIGETHIASILIVAVQFSRAAFLVGAAALFGTLLSLIYAAILQGIVQTAVLLSYLHFRFHGFSKAFDWPLMRRQLSYSVPLGLGGLLYRLQIDLHNYVVSNRFGPALFAVYAIGTFQLPLLGLLQEATTSVLIPRIGVLQQQNDHREVLLLTARAMRKLAAVYLPCFALFLVVGREFIVFLFTQRYRDSWPVFAIYLLLLPTTILLQDPLFRAYASERYFLLRYRAFILVVLVAALWLATSRFGLLGAISAVVAVGYLDQSITAVHFGRILGVGWKDLVLLKDVGKIALACLAAALLTAIARAALLGYRPIVILLACGTLFALSYGAAILVSGILTREEWDFLRARLAFLSPRSSKTAPI